MKKLALTIAIVLGLSMTTFAEGNHGGGLFQRGVVDEEYYGMGSYSNGLRTGNAPMLPYHGQTENQDANGPIGSGIAVLLGLGAAYLVGKRRKED
jgi:hypothetical protein